MEVLSKIKHILLFLTIVLSAIFVSCRQDIDNPLREAETVVDTRPDSAHNLLAKLDPNTLTTPKDRHVYDILLTEARYKSGLNDTAVSQIAAAALFFDKDIKSLYRLKAYYYNAIINKNNQDFGEGLINASQAEKSALASNNIKWLALVHRCIGDLYDAIRRSEIAKNYYSLSLKEFKSIESDYTEDAIYDLCRSYFNNDETDSCLTLAKELYRKGTDSGKQYLKINSLQTSALCYYKQEKYDSVINCFTPLANAYPASMTVQDWNYLGMAYLKTGNVKEADTCADSIISRSDRPADLLCEIAAAKGDYKKAYELKSEICRINDEIYRRWVSMSQEKELMDNYKLQETELALEESKNIIYLLVSIIAVLSLIAITTFLWKKLLTAKKKNREMAHTLSELEKDLGLREEELESLSRDYSESSTSLRKAIEESRSAVRSLIGEQYKMLDSLMSRYHDIKGSESEKKEIYKEVMRIISSFRDNRKVIVNFEKIINLNLDNLINRFVKDNPSLDSVDKNLFIFIVLGFSAKTISVIQDIPYDRVYNRKRALKKKIEEKSAGNPTQYLIYF